MKSLEPNVLADSKYWLKHVFFPFAGRGSTPPTHILLKDGYFAHDTDELKAGCKALYEEITERKWKDLDGILNTFSKYYFENENSINAQKIKMSETFVANALAWMCKVNEIEWNDFSHSPYELADFKKTILGKALWNFECFASQYVKAMNSDNINQPKQPKQSTKSTTKSNSGTNSWKARGPLSAQVRDIVSQPGNKEYVNASVIYTIDDIYIKGKKTRAFIRPLKPAAAINGTNKVYIGNSNNYDDCTCYFDSRAAAQEFLDKIEASGAYSGTLSIEKNKVDSNGYFIVNTELGKCLIRAFNLNEEVEEVLEENLEFSSEEKANDAFEKLYSMLD